MSQPAAHFERGRTFDENVDRWVARVLDRLRARDPNRPPFDRDLFTAEMEHDHPHRPDISVWAGRFEAALKEANGNIAAFERALGRRAVR